MTYIWLYVDGNEQMISQQTWTHTSCIYCVMKTMRGYGLEMSPLSSTAKTRRCKVITVLYFVVNVKFSFTLLLWLGAPGWKKMGCSLCIFPNLDLHLICKRCWNDICAMFCAFRFCHLKNKVDNKCQIVELICPKCTGLRIKVLIYSIIWFLVTQNMH